MKPDPIYRERLLRLADELEKERIPFAYYNWVGNGWDGKPEIACGTTACALGLATTMPEFRELGLEMAVTHLPSIHDVGEYSGHPRLRGSELIGSDAVSEAAAAIFGLDFHETLYLFYPNHFLGEELPPSPSTVATAKEVAEHIRNFVAYMDPEQVP